MSALTEQIRTVAQRRAVWAQLQAEWKKLHEDFSTENAPLMEAMKAQGELLATEENVLRTLTIAEFSSTGSKAPEKGVGIKVMTETSYPADKAFEWAMEHKLALALDKKAFEGIIKVQKLPFVTTKEVPTATIATDLSFALEMVGVA